jgi:hypothetical protein
VRLTLSVTVCVPEVTVTVREAGQVGLPDTWVALVGVEYTIVAVPLICLPTFSPQHLSALPEAITQAKALPTLSDEASERPETLTGVRASVMEPLPSCMLMFKPQHFAAPVESITQE